MNRSVSLALLCIAVCPLAAQNSGGYHISNKSVLGGEGGWDYVVPNPETHRLYIARVDRLMVVDEKSGKLVGVVLGIHGAHGTAIAGGRGFATSSEDKSIVVFDTKSLKVLSRIPAAEDADAIVYDEPSGRVFSMNGDANSSTVVDAKTSKVVTTLALGGKPEYAVSKADGKIYANLEDKDEIVEIDTRSATIGRRWSTAPCKQPVAMAVDTERHRLMTGCRSGVLVVSDYVAGKVVATAPIGKGVDGAGYDPSTHDVFASGADGTLTVIHQDTADTYHVVQTVETPQGSRNMGLDPDNHRIYVVSAQFGQAPIGGRRKPVLPGSFTLLTIER